MAATQAAAVHTTQTGLAFSGVIDHQSIPKLTTALSAMQTSGPSIDLSNVSKIDSAGLAFLIHWGNENLAAGQTMLLNGASRQVNQLINIMGLNAFFEMQGDSTH